MSRTKQQIATSEGMKSWWRRRKSLPTCKCGAKPIHPKCDGENALYTAVIVERDRYKNEVNLLHRLIEELESERDYLRTVARDAKSAITVAKEALRKIGSLGDAMLNDGSYLYKAALLAREALAKIEDGECYCCPEGAAVKEPCGLCIGKNVLKGEGK